MRLLPILLCLAFVGCHERQDAPTVPKAKAPDAAVPTDREELREELNKLYQRKVLLEDSLERANEAALQTKLWLAAGTLTLAGLVLIGLGIWTTRKLLVTGGVAVLGLAGACVVAVHLVPYLFWLGIGAVATVAGMAVWMLRNRENALTQVSSAVQEAKDRLPEFRANYRDIFRSNIDTGADRILNTIRRNHH